MKIVRNYNKASKHRWWKITLEPITDSVFASNRILKHLEFSAYAFSSPNDFSNQEIKKEPYSDSISFIGTSREDVISKEKKMLEVFYESIFNDLQENEKWLSEMELAYERKKKYFESFLQIPEFKQISLHKKIQKLK